MPRHVRTPNQWVRRDIVRSQHSLKLEFRVATTSVLLEDVQPEGRALTLYLVVGRFGRRWTWM